MPTHVRAQIRQSVVSILTAAATSAGANVFGSRVLPLAANRLPALRVYAQEEAVEPLTIHGGSAALLERELTLAVECVARANDALDDTLDALALAVETALAADFTLGSTCKTSSLSGVEIEMDADGEQQLGVARLNYRVLYMTAANAPGTLT